MLRRAAQRVFRPQTKHILWSAQVRRRSEKVHAKFSPFVDAPGGTIDLLKAFSFYHTFPHPEISPYIFLTTSLYNELGAIGLLSHQMRNYPHRILFWTELVLNSLPNFTEKEIQSLDHRSKEYLEQKFRDPYTFLMDRRTNLIASALYTVKDLSGARFASERKEFKNIDFDPDTLLYGNILQCAESIELDNPILFVDTQEALINQFTRIAQLPTEDIKRVSFPFSYWLMWWGLYYLTGDKILVRAIVQSLSNFLKNDSNQENPLMEQMVQQLTTNGYTHSRVYALLSSIKDNTIQYKWLGKVIEDIDKMNHEHGAFSLDMYEREQPIRIPSTNQPLLLNHVPNNMQIPIGLICPPPPYTILKDTREATVQAAMDRGFMLSNGSFDEDVMVETLNLLMENHQKKVEEAGKELKEEITLTHELLYKTLELRAYDNPKTNFAILHCLAKLSVLFFAHRRPEAFVSGKVTKDKANIKAIYWYNKLLDLQPDEPLINYELGLLLKAIEDYQGAMGPLEKALQLDHSEVGVHLTEVMNELGIQTAYDSDF